MSVVGTNRRASRRAWVNCGGQRRQAASRHVYGQSVGDGLDRIVAAKFQRAVDRHQDRLGVRAARAHVVKRVLARDDGGANLAFGAIVVGSDGCVVEKDKQAIAVFAQSFDQPGRIVVFIDAVNESLGNRIYGTEGQIILSKPLRVFTNRDIDGLTAGEWTELEAPRGHSRATFFNRFTESLFEGNPLDITGQDARKTLELICAAYQSGAERQAIAMGNVPVKSAG